MSFQRPIHWNHSQENVDGIFFIILTKKPEPEIDQARKIASWQVSSPPLHVGKLCSLCREGAAHPGDGAGTADHLRPVEQLTCPRPSQAGHSKSAGGGEGVRGQEEGTSDVEQSTNWNQESTERTNRKRRGPQRNSKKIFPINVSSPIYFFT
jgi:hypothetical protein